MRSKLLLLACLSTCFLSLFFWVTPTRAGTVITISTNSDTINSFDGKCTLREAIIAANTDTTSGSAVGECPAGSGADTIVLPAGSYDLTFVGADDAAFVGDLDITQPVTLVGHDLGDTIIHQTVAERVFEIFSPANVAISNVTITGGNDMTCNGGGGIANHSVLSLANVQLSSNTANCAGGGMWNAATASANLNSVYFTLNSATNNGGSIYNSGILTLTLGHLLFNNALNGAGIFNDGTGAATITFSIIEAENARQNGGGIWNNNLLMITNSTINNNNAHGNGGGIYDQANVSLTNVTLSSNNAISTTLGYGNGGGLYTSGYVTLTNATVYGNFATISGGGIYRDPSASPLPAKNTILSSSTSGGNCGGSAITSLGYNLDSANTCGLAATGDITTTDPLLGSLTDNGGNTYTRALLLGSPAINRIPFGTNGCGTTVTTDQRGYARIGPCDIGAFEYVLRLFLPLIKR